MPMGTVAPVWRQQFCNPAGQPFAHGTIEVFMAGTDVHAVVYQDQTVTVPHPWPIPLNAAGMTAEAMFLLPGSYHFYVKDAAGVLQWDDDLVSAVPPSSLDVDTPATFGEAVTLGTVVYESIGLGGKTAGLWYKTTTANDWSSSAATVVGLATADYASGATGFVRLVGRMTKLSGLVVGSVYYASATPGVMTPVKPATNILQIGIPDSTSSILLAIVVAGQFQAWTPSGGIATVVGELHVGGNTVLSGALSVVGAASFPGGVTGGLAVSGATTLASLSVTGTASVTGATTLASLTVTGTTTLGAVNTGLIVATTVQANNVFQIGGGTAAFPAWRRTGARMEAVLADQSNWASITAQNYTSISGGNVLADLTVTGATNFAGGVTTSGGNINTTGAIFSTGVYYPGRVDVAGQQGSWYLGSHAAYGLYSNTGLFLAGNLTVTASASVGGLLTAGRRFTAVGPSGDYIVYSGGTFTVTLPAPVNGAIVDVKNYGSGVITVAAPGGVFLDYPATFYQLVVPNQSVTVVAISGNWWIR
jgi:hypothetical protein